MPTLSLPSCSLAVLVSRLGLDEQICAQVCMYVCSSFFKAYTGLKVLWCQWELFQGRVCSGVHGHTQ